MGSVSQQARDIAGGIIHNCGYKSAVLSGVAGDPAHLERGGYHCSVLELRAHGNQNDYSNTKTADHDQNVAYASAIDISLSSSEMVKAFGRVHAVWLDRTDPRRVFINAINGWDGSGDATRLNFDAGTSEYASPDHKWHNHMEIHRKYILDARAARAVVSIYSGESKTAWYARENPPRKVDYMTFEVTLPALQEGDNDDDFPNTYRRITRIQKLVGATVDGDWGVHTTAAIASWCKVDKSKATVMTENLWREIFGLS